MKNITALICVTFCLTCLLNAHAQHRRRVHVDYATSRIYCQNYRQEGVTGYSLYRETDHRDLGSAVFTNRNMNQCRDIARHANNWMTGVACSPHNKKWGMFNIMKNELIGAEGFNQYIACIQSMRDSRNNTVCAPYFDVYGNRRIAQFNIHTGNLTGYRTYNKHETCNKDIR